MSLYKILERHDLGESLGEEERFAQDVLFSLSTSPKTLPSRYFYDTRGSQLFAEITDLEEYYPTNCEFQILQHHKTDIMEAIGQQAFNLIELGAGDGRKTKVLLEHFLEQKLNFRYIPIDISEAAVKGLTTSLKSQFPDLNTQGLVSEYFDGIAWMKRHSKRRNLVVFLGSSIGNFEPAQMRSFLMNLWAACKHDDLLLIGFDLKKDPMILQAAYADSKGVTGKFNLNLLERINRELGANFDLNKFEHFASYNFLRGSMESYLVSKVPQEVYIKKLQKRFEFDAWEPIHTEFSFKYSLRQIHATARQCGYSVTTDLFDRKRWFCDSIWQVEKE